MTDQEAHVPVPQPAQIAQHVTTLRSIEAQVGEHVIAALRAPNTVAVMSAVVVGPDGKQHIISTPLDPQKLAEVQTMLRDGTPANPARTPCVGFHCYLDDPDEETAE